MLTCRLTDSDTPAVQLHAIDLLYNMSIHSNMLLSEGWTDISTAAKREVGSFADRICCVMLSTLQSTSCSSSA